MLTTEPKKFLRPQSDEAIGAMTRWASSGLMVKGSAAWMSYDLNTIENAYQPAF